MNDRLFLQYQLLKSSGRMLYLCIFKQSPMEDNVLNEPLAAYGRPASFEQVWQLFIETNKQFKETDKQFKETDKQFKETEKQIKENDRLITEKFKETDKRIKELSKLFTSQWGKLVESLVEGDLVKLLNKRGINVERTIQRVKGNRDGENFEYDIVAVNGSEIVIVEVKTTLRVDDVNDFHEKLWKAKRYMPEYSDKNIYGGVAFIISEGASERMSEKLGFFVIRATGNSSSIINKIDFKPKSF